MRAEIKSAETVSAPVPHCNQTEGQCFCAQPALNVRRTRQRGTVITLSLAACLIGTSAQAQTVAASNSQSDSSDKIAKTRTQQKADKAKKKDNQYQKTVVANQKADDPFAKFNNLTEKGMEVGIPGPADTVTQDIGGVRSALASVGVGYVAWTQNTFVDNVLPNAAKSTIANQLYSGQNPTFYTSNYMMVTYDLSRYGIPDGQVIVGTERQWATWNPVLPDRWGINEIAYYQTFFDRKLELKVGYLRNSNEFGVSLASANAGANVFGPSGSILYQGGMSSNQAPTPAINLKLNVDGNWYDKISFQRAISPDGVATYINQNPTGLDWRTPNAGLLVLNEFGYQGKAAPGSPQTVFRAGAGFNNSSYTNLEYPKQPRADENGFYYLTFDQQLWQSNVRSSASHGIYGGFSVMYAPPDLNTVSQYYEVRLYSKGLFESRPDDQISLVVTDTVWSNFAVAAAAAQGKLVHSDSKGISATYSAHLAPGIYTSVGLSYINNPTAITYTPPIGHALNFSVTTSIFF
ncbi:carbohydrate porin [Bradyrhizobium sp. CCBAU 53421]|uniref:carbohydrate porin n=1 Tax=Bradyrhizobium sp. CCBAU 53421 TaxID=1325120 RepID=UPI00188D7A13|nr:carbohydrate porin [Bradyrhizobium sp. CCBAU 53421]QOZ33229.1 carbohydrate porin [Bradyrhizobium sp. CCBAU 53421]